ncbi:MAG: 23S rRNA (adenine(2503)-C(2))-methyltransferase RlmN [Acidobacteria bacterium]|nr:23S rRNA (adenine(2503)-C(2))-methyltransferase RlmN [Acidobacteriota bacterium]
MDRTELLGMDLEELCGVAESLGEKKFRGKQLYHQLYRRQNLCLDTMTDVSRRFRTLLAERATLYLPAIRQVQCSEDGTVKYLLELDDGARVESVYLPEEERTTLCLSTQVGCAMHCAFCATGAGGFVRDLSAGEILAQYLVISREHGLLNQSINIVFMGMGEPLLNVEAVLKAFAILTDPSGCALSRRKITLSTCGIRSGMARLAQTAVRPKLAVSLNASSAEQRRRLMPCERQYPLAELLADCRRFPLRKGERITFEYILIRDVNDQPADARRLVRLLREIRCKINLIAYNECPGLPFRSPTGDTILAFQNVLVEAGYSAFIRKSRGPDIQAACGQLTTRPAEVPGL